MSDRRSGDLSSEERKLNPSAREEPDRLQETLIDGFDGTAEVLFLGIPFFFVVVFTGDDAYKFFAGAAIAGAAVAVTALRSDRVSLLPAWPSNAPTRVALRGVIYNVGLLAGANTAEALSTGGNASVAWADGPVLVPALVSLVVAAAVAATVPSLSRLLFGGAGR
jgi:hypothetical protein